MTVSKTQHVYDTHRKQSNKEKQKTEMPTQNNKWKDLIQEQQQRKTKIY